MKRNRMSWKPVGLITTILFLILLFVFSSRVTSYSYEHHVDKFKSRHQQCKANVNLVMAYFDAIDNQDADAIADLFSEDAVQEFVGNAPIIGADTIAQQLDLAFSQLDAMQTKIINVIAEEDMVFIHVRHVATFAAGGVYKTRDGIIPAVVIIEEPTQVTWQAMVTFSFEDGVITKEVIIRDDLSMMTQIGRVSIENP